MRRALIAAGLCAACGSGAGLAVEAECNPLGDGPCMAPWPASVFEVDDPTTATGRRLAIPAGTLPSPTAATIDPTAWNRADGFSASAPIVVAVRAGVAPHGLPPLDNMDLSLAADSATVILDMTSGERVAHHAEVDASGALVLQPAKRLDAGHRYAVAITERVRARDGEPLAPPAGFVALRDGVLTDHHLLEAARPRLDEALDALDAEGVTADELVLAWDFTVASESHALGELRDRLLPLPSYELAIERTAKQRDGSRIVHGSVIAPRLAGGTHRVAWRMLVPACATKRVPLVLYGHALLGDAREVDVQVALASEPCRAIAGADLAGLSSHDTSALVRMVGALDDGAVFDALAQGVIDQVALAHALRGELSATPLGTLVDARELTYVGASQLTSVLALAPVSRGVLTGGAPITSRVLDRYRLAIAMTYPDPIDALLVGVLAQMRWDAFELQPRVPVLLAAPADPATIWHARSLGLALVPPAPFTPWGLPVVGNPDTDVGIRHEISGYAPCCARPPCAPTPSACLALPRSP